MKIIIPILIIFSLGCNTNSKVVQSASDKSDEFVPDFAAGVPVMVYKTKADYNKLVPVILSDDKTTIVSYPHPNDIRSGNSFQFPDPLHDGYLLDNRGIGKNVAFLKLSYEEYANLESVPDLKQLFELIIDKDPLTELCNCGLKTAFTDEQAQLNELIDANKMRKSCKVIK